MRKVVGIGSVKIGGSNPVAVQSMCNTKTSDVNATVRQILTLEKAGCEIVRLSVPDMLSARALKRIRKLVKIPLVADIHFDYRLAVASAPFVDKLRINPGNIGLAKIRFVVESARKYGMPIRIGVNSGSIEKDLLTRYGHSPRAMFESVKRNVNILESYGFTNIVISAKMSDVTSTISVCRMIAKKFRYPMHVGITEAGTLLDGSIKSSLGIGILLSEGIGDTIRVSVTENPVKEVEVGYSILQFLGLRRTRREIISCPTCSRTKVDLIAITKEIEKKTENIRSPIRIAVMGCVVNGPGEARNADIGIACGNKMGVIFRNGKIIRSVSEDKIVEELMKEIRLTLA
ncbi:MAG: flavodoxin-dependent (E)-4-hydroxy-3-methylbut-2-enyl-diphosphate synthase [Candidatus Woesearchaeota archaeon]